MLKLILDISGERRTYPQKISINEDFFSIGIYSVNPLSIQKQCNYCQIDCCHTSKWQVDVVRGTTDWSTSASASFYVPWCWVRHANICALVTSWIAQLSPYCHIGDGHQSIRDSYTPTAKAFLLWIDQENHTPCLLMATVVFFVAPRWFSSHMSKATANQCQGHLCLAQFLLQGQDFLEAVTLCLTEAHPLGKDTTVLSINVVKAGAKVGYSSILWWIMIFSGNYQFIAFTVA